MALAPTEVASPAPGEAAMPDAMGGAPADMPMEGEGEAGEVIATVCRKPDGSFVLYRGDEPEEGAEMAAEGEAPMDEGETFEDGPALLRAVMGLLESGAEAEKAFMDEPAKAPMPMA